MSNAALALANASIFFVAYLTVVLALSVALIRSPSKRTNTELATSNSTKVKPMVFRGSNLLTPDSSVGGRGRGRMMQNNETDLIARLFGYK